MDGQGAVWITRAEPGAAATAARVDALGFRSLIAPLLTVRMLDHPFSLEGVCALAFTSANGVRAFADRTARRDIKVFTVGDATARAARTAGFGDVTSADDDSAALVQLIVQNAPAGRVLCPGPRQQAADVPGDLRHAGVAAEPVVLYETIAPALLPEVAVAALTAREVGAVLIHSARAGEAFTHLAGPYDLTRTAIIGLSAACLQPLAALKTGPRIAAEAPRETALIEALLTAAAPALGKPPPAR